MMAMIAMAVSGEHTFIAPWSWCATPVIPFP